MALCFNTPLPDLEDELMQLILDGHIKARIDSINKVSNIYSIQNKNALLSRIQMNR